MSDIFENDIDEENMNLDALEDSYSEEESVVGYEFDQPLYCLKLFYSCESLYAKNDKKLDLNPGDYVIVPTRYGRDLARVLGQSKKPMGVKPSDVIQIDRKASKDDIARADENKKREEEAFKVSKEKVEYHKLDMKLIAVHFLVDEPKALFFFSSDNRVDFRELVKDLVSVFKMRIELRQIGVRDEARITGGLGVCGRPFCCHGVSDKLRPVSIRMAKDQNLSLNSMKISGQCGRLLCCLSYEFDWYNEARKKLPSEGLRIYYDGTNFKITEVNPLTSMVKMLGEDGRLLEVNAKRFVKDGNRWKIN
ncbi:regulatory iron-sulfur-containing complex subunit RicT [uncultured Treponema sp.]|uniref:PSP1 domain-containing protein n=1 Tax=uncultured Treponema sp. TaxID=162155 RepID=UPI0025948B3B|nr:regulatory iron-sulfur-containing complex subunit RicT [uncultured Treponema sp.]